MTTETEKTNNQRTPGEGYGVIEMRYLCAKQLIIRSTGEIVDVTDAMRLLYIYMLNQFLGFSSRGMSFYKDQREMAAALGWDRKKVMRSLDGLKKIGLVEEAGKIGNSEAYTVYFFSDIAESLAVVHGDWKGAPAWDHDRASGKKTRRKTKTKKSEEKQEDGKSNEEATPQAEQAATAATPPTNESPDNPADSLAVVSAAPIVGQHDRVASNDDSGGNDGSDGADAVRHQQTADRVIAPLDDLRYWSDVGGSEGLDSYGAIWGVSGTALYNLIAEHLQIREAEAEKNFKSQRIH